MQRLIHHIIKVFLLYIVIIVRLRLTKLLPCFLFLENFRSLPLCGFCGYETHQPFQNHLDLALQNCNRNSFFIPPIFWCVFVLFFVCLVIFSHVRLQSSVLDIFSSILKSYPTLLILSLYINWVGWGLLIRVSLFFFPFFTSKVYVLIFIFFLPTPLVVYLCPFQIHRLLPGHRMFVEYLQGPVSKLSLPFIFQAFFSKP